MIGKNVKEIRLKKGLTQVQLADLADLPQATIHYIENGKNPRMDTLSKVAKALDVKPEELFKEEDESE